MPCDIIRSMKVIGIKTLRSAWILKFKHKSFFKLFFFPFVCINYTVYSSMKLSLALVRHKQSILLMSSFLLGNYCSLIPMGVTYFALHGCFYGKTNACYGHLFLLPRTAGTKVNVRLPLPQTITSFPCVVSGFQRLYEWELFSYLRNYLTVSGLRVYQKVAQEL